jgi:hypothetical protein
MCLNETENVNSCLMHFLFTMDRNRELLYHHCLTDTQLVSPRSEGGWNRVFSFWLIRHDRLEKTA